MGRACLQLGVTLCAAIAYLGLTYVAVAASPQAECHGILHRDRGYIRFGGNAGEGEGVCVVSRSEQARVLQKRLEGAFMALPDPAETLENASRSGALAGCKNIDTSMLVAMRPLLRRLSDQSRAHPVRCRAAACWRSPVADWT
jgi:hypothetical protein